MALEFNMCATIAKKFEMKRDGIHKILCFAGGAAQFKRATKSANAMFLAAFGKADILRYCDDRPKHFCDLDCAVKSLPCSSQIQKLVILMRNLTHLERQGQDLLKLLHFQGRGFNALVNLCAKGCPNGSKWSRC